MKKVGNLLRETLIQKRCMSKLKHLIPTRILDWRRKQKYKSQKSRFKSSNYQTSFQTIYKENYWGSEESVSGQGSTRMATSAIVGSLSDLLHSFQISQILDIPCGDFNWMQHVTFPTDCSYVGCDIVPDLIESNQKNFGNEKVRFEQLDLLSNDLTPVDLIIIRDCWVHFSYTHIYQSLKKVKNSQSTYLLVTTFKDVKLNYDITTGDWRPINLEKAPFNFPKPIVVIEESVPKEYKKDFRGKCLALYKISDL